jgi:hypothetical protein
MSLPSCSQIIDAYTKGDIDYLEKHKKSLLKYYRDDCAKESLYDIFTESSEDQIAYIETVKIDNSRMNYPNKFKSFKFLIEENILDPNELNKGRLMIATCIQNFTAFDIQKERLDILFKYTKPEVIRGYLGEYINYYDKYNSFTKSPPVLHNIVLLLHHCNTSNDNFIMILEKLINIGVDLNVIAEYDEKDYIGDYDSEIYRKKISFLYMVTIRAIPKYVLMALDLKQDPNLIIGPKSKKNANIAQELLYKNIDTKDQKKIDDIIQTIILLVKNGLDTNYRDLEGLNLIGYVDTFGWANVMLGDKTFKQTLIDMGCPIQKRIRKSLCGIMNNMFDFMLDNVSNDEINKPAFKCMILLNDTRLEKNQTNIKKILDDLKELNKDMNEKDLKEINGMLYKEFCESGPWRNTIVSEYLKKWRDSSRFSIFS